jgi:hypothetical protein
MSSVINNSNANSALVNTINASESKMNPNVYSTKRIYPAAAVVYQDTDKSSGTIGNGNTITFDLMKYGIAQQFLFCWTKAPTNGTAAYDFLHVIDRIELLSSSKVIDTLTNMDLLAQFSDLDVSQFDPIFKAGIKERNNGAGKPDEVFCLPLVFGFCKDINTNLNLQFNEGMSIRVKFGAHSDLSYTAGTANAVKNAYLKTRYKVYNEADYSEILTQNYNEPELSILTTGFYDENVAVATVANGATNNGANGTPVELKNTDCVNNFYVCVRAQMPAQTKVLPPLQIDRVKMTASGQVIFDLTGEELNYSRLCENGFSVQGTGTNTVGSQTSYVKKIQMGLWEYSGGGTQSNTVSLRELNNPVITVYFTTAQAAADTNYDVYVMEDAIKVISTVSSSGRVQTSLTN